MTTAGTTSCYVTAVVLLPSKQVFSTRNGEQYSRIFGSVMHYRVTGGGKNVPPVNIENLSHLIWIFSTISSIFHLYFPTKYLLDGATS